MTYVHYLPHKCMIISTILYLALGFLWVIHVSCHTGCHNLCTPSKHGCILVIGCDVWKALWDTLCVKCHPTTSRDTLFVRCSPFYVQNRWASLLYEYCHICDAVMSSRQNIWYTRLGCLWNISVWHLSIHRLQNSYLWSCTK